MIPMRVQELLCRHLEVEQCGVCGGRIFGQIDWFLEKRGRLGRWQICSASVPDKETCRCSSNSVLFVPGNGHLWRLERKFVHMEFGTAREQGCQTNRLQAGKRYR